MKVHKRISGIALAILWGGLGWTMPVCAEEDSMDPAASGGSKPTAVFEEEVFATDTPPPIPTSNTVVTKLPLSLERTPASVSVVTDELLEERDAVILGDALRNVAGVNVETGNAVFDFFVVRGLDSVSSGLILTDGAPEPESSFYQMYNVERVEVLRGPSAFVYGGGPLGGTVNLVRERPFADDQIEVGTRFGSFDTYEGRADVNLSNDDGSLAFRLHGMARESEGYRERQDSDALGFTPALTWRPNDHTSLQISYERLDLDYTPDAGLPLIFGADGSPSVPDVPRRESYGTDLDVSEQDVNRGQVDFESHLTERLVFRNKTYYRNLDWLSRSTSLNGVFPDPRFGRPLVARTLLLLDDEQDFFGNQAEALLWIDDGGAVSHHLLAGVEIRRFTDEFTFDVGLLGQTGLIDPFNSLVPDTVDEVPLLPGQSLAADATSEQISPYLVDQIGIGEKFQVLLGARFDRIDFEERLSGTDRTDEEISPMLGVVYRPADRVSLYGNYSEAFAPPSTFAIAPDRVPEESRQVEVGLKTSFAQGKARATFAVYDLERENLAIPDATGILRQVGTQEAQGFEAELVTSLTDGVDLTAGYAYTDGELTEFTEIVQVGFDAFQLFDRSGNTPAFTPEHLLNLWVSKRFARGFGVGVGGRYVSDQAIDEDNAFEIDAYGTLDLGAWWDRGPWRLSVNVDNLLDEDYLTRGFGNTAVIPGPGIAAYAGVDYRF